MITFGFGAVKIIEKTPTPTDHREKTAAGGKVLYGVLQVGGEVVDSLRQESDLNIGRTCVLIVETVS
jgi:hypothetical protein